MKKQSYFLFLALLLLAGAFLPGCLKDTVYKSYTYTLTRPVYKAKEEVIAQIKNDAPIPVSAPGKMYLLGKYIFLNELGRGIHVINNSNPAHPIVESFVHIPGCGDLAAYGNTLYADCYTDLIVLDITSPKKVTFIRVLPSIFPDRVYANGYALSQGMVITEWITKDTTITEKIENGTFLQGGIIMDANFNAFSSSTLNYSSTQKGTGGSMARFAIAANHLYTVSSSQLEVLNIQHPMSPEWKKRINLGWGIETIFPFKNKLFIGSNTGMQIFSISDPANPEKNGTFQHATVCDPVIADDRFAYVTLRSGNMCRGMTNQLDVVNIENINSPTLVKSYPFTNPHGLSKDGVHLFVCDGKDGLKVLNAAQPNAIQLITTIPMASTYDVILLQRHCHCFRSRWVVSIRLFKYPPNQTAEQNWPEILTTHYHHETHSNRLFVVVWHLR